MGTPVTFKNCLGNEFKLTHIGLSHVASRESARRSAANIQWSHSLHILFHNQTFLNDDCDDVSTS